MPGIPRVSLKKALRHTGGEVAGYKSFELPEPEFSFSNDEQNHAERMSKVVIFGLKQPDPQITMSKSLMF